MRYTLSILFFACLALHAAAQQTIPLYKGPIPNSIPSPNIASTDKAGSIQKISIPELVVYLPPKDSSNRTAIIICPGGGYHDLVIGYEGYPIAEKLRNKGMTCFILKYRLPDTAIMKDKSIGPLQDLQRAIQMVREGAKKWNIDSNKIGVIGFSAGGHLVSTAGTHFNKSYIENKENTSLRPDFMILVYPVISMLDSLTHQGSKNNLLGANPDNAKVMAFSNEFQVTPQTPPTFLIQASDDKVVSVKNSIAFYEALLKQHVSAGMHIFPIGDHGFTFGPGSKGNFLNYCVSWLGENGWLDRPGYRYQPN